MLSDFFKEAENNQSFGLETSEYILERLQSGFHLIFT